MSQRSARPRQRAAVVLSCLLWLQAGGSELSAETKPRAVELKLSAWRHIRFQDTPPTHYQEQHGQLWAQVTRSSSFLLLPFGKPQSVSHLSFEWRLEGRPRVSDAEQEETRAGDDLPLRVGLLLAGPEPSGFLGLGVPGWVKQVRSELEHESNRILFFVAGSRHAPGTRWLHPSSGDIEQRAVASVPAPAGWQRSSVELEGRASVVGLWLMADGDDTQSSFRAGIRNLSLR